MFMKGALAEPSSMWWQDSSAKDFRVGKKGPSSSSFLLTFEREAATDLRAFAFRVAVELDIGKNWIAARREMRFRIVCFGGGIDWRDRGRGSLLRPTE